MTGQVGPYDGGGGHPRCASDGDIRVRERSREEGRQRFQ